MSSSQYQLPQQDEFKNLLASIRNCEAIRDFIDVYDAGVVYACLERMRTAQRLSGKSVEQWAEGWAKSLYQGAEDAKTLNRDRKLSLELLYTLLNKYKGDKVAATLTAENIIVDFGVQRIMGILGLCLPMDRANALYNMTLPGASEPGMHWVSEVHLVRDAEWADRMKDYDGFPTMNKRFLWLMEDEALAGLNLSGNRFMQEYTTPKAA